MSIFSRENGYCCCISSRCRRAAEEKEDEQLNYLGRILAPIRPCDATDANLIRRNRPHIFILGPQASGKTVLFLRLVYPQIDVNDSIGIVSETDTFHVEPAVFAGRECLLWDIGGWPHMIRPVVETMCACETRGIIWMVSMLDSRKEHIAKHRRVIHELLANVALNRSFFMMIFNTHDLFADESAPYELTQRGIEAITSTIRAFNLTEFATEYPARFIWGVVNVKEGLSDPRLASLSDWMNIYLTYH